MTSIDIWWSVETLLQPYAAYAVGEVDSVTGEIDCKVVCVGPVESLTCGVDDRQSDAA